MSITAFVMVGPSNGSTPHGSGPSVVALLGENFGPSLSVFEAELLALCPQRGEPLLERGNDVIADLGRREGDPVYKPTPTIDLIFGADDHLIGIAIHSDEALRLLDLLHQISDGHALVSTGGLGDRAQRCSNILPEAGWRQLSSDPRRLIDQALSGRAAGIVVEHAEAAELVDGAADRRWQAGGIQPVERDGGSQTQRWREVDSNHRSPSRD